MKKKVLGIAVIAASAGLAGGWALAQIRGPRTRIWTSPSCRATGPGRMGPGMMGRGAQGDGTRHYGHEPWFRDHGRNERHPRAVRKPRDRIKRTVTDFPDGIRTATELDDPRIAELIKTYVASMGERVRAGNDPGLPIESPALHSIFRDKDKIQTTYETTATGVIVVQTSTDFGHRSRSPAARFGRSDFVKGGMAAMHSAMMRNGGMTHGGPMMHSAPAQ